MGQRVTLNMLPRFSIDNPRYSGLTHVITLGNLFSGHSTDRPNIKDILFGKFGIISRTAMTVSLSGNHIIDIILIGASSEVSRITTCRVITRMKNKMATCINAFKFECKSVCKPSLAAKSGHTISSWIPITSPFQTIAIRLEQVRKILFSKYQLHRFSPFNESIIDHNEGRVNNE